MALASQPGHAGAADTMAEASMLVEGTAVINPDGSVASYKLKQQEKLPPPIVGLIAQALPAWKFQFRTPPAAPVEENMSLRIVATDADRTHMTLRIASAQFEQGAQPENEILRYASQKRPLYPRLSLDGRMSGTVYVLVLVDRDGKVTEAAAEQVNLRRYTDKRLMELYRKDLANAALKAIRQWTFHVPTAGSQAQAPSWYGRVPVTFSVNNMDPNDGSKYGTWEIYVRGPRETIPWLQDRRLLAEEPDATPDGALHQLDGGAKLLTPLSPN
ncbi:energy transducer TonB [Dyella soli]|uniref:Energy transducer TonB n=1 Tax=Dyella soli TaxID=522319 RepID=A0A4R0YEA9_9GAMM|nr:energy transducer TonB [Dyella soli]TCI06470.1 energy transducer TonB [Dyella soli]